MKKNKVYIRYCWDIQKIVSRKYPFFRVYFGQTHSISTAKKHTEMYILDISYLYSLLVRVQFHSDTIYDILQK